MKILLVQAIVAGSFNKNDTKFLITLIICHMGEAMTIIQNVTSCFQVAKTTGTRDRAFTDLNSPMGALDSVFLFQLNMTSE